MSNEVKNKDSAEECTVTTFQVMLSVIASILGVQKRETLERDFKCGKLRQFIIVALLMTLAFIFFVYGLVQVAFWYFGV